MVVCGAKSEVGRAAVVVVCERAARCPPFPPLSHPPLSLLSHRNPVLDDQRRAGRGGRRARGLGGGGRESAVSVGERVAARLRGGLGGACAPNSPPPRDARGRNARCGGGATAGRGQGAAAAAVGRPLPRLSRGGAPSLAPVPLSPAPRTVASGRAAMLEVDVRGKGMVAFFEGGTAKRTRASVSRSRHGVGSLLPLFVSPPSPPTSDAAHSLWLPPGRRAAPRYRSS